MIISTHIPKVAGTSFAQSLKSAYGKGYISDYRDMNLITDFPKFASLKSRVLGLLPQSNNMAVIHGHFLPVKYKYLVNDNNAKFITWVREPSERLLSHYNFWCSPPTHQNISLLRKKMLTEKWTFEDFYSNKKIINLNSKYFNGFNIERFNFIGIMEQYDEEIVRLTHILNKSIEPVVKNVTKSKSINIVTDKQRRDIQTLHNEDYEIYEFACQKK